MISDFPKHYKPAYNCPHCGVYAKQHWYLVAKATKPHNSINYNGIIDSYSVSQCEHCQKPSFWNATKMIFPYSGTVALPNSDLPKDIADDYNEARDIVELSPRGAVALLRLAIQKLCIHLGEDGKNINQDIGKLVKKGLSPKMQQALDSVRVIGNNAVHPGVLDLKDDIEIAKKLFAFVNIIADVMITQPSEIDKFYNDKVPIKSKDEIKKRDQK